jgi:TolA-binding protein
MFKKFVFAAAIVFALSVASTTKAQGGNSISGQVYNTANRPVANLHVELLSDFDSLIGRTKTDGIGRYLFVNLARGNYQVRVITAGTNYVSQTARVEIFTISTAPGRGRASEIYNFTLKTVDEEKSKGHSKSPSTLFSQEVPDTARKLYEEAVEKLDKNQSGVEALDGLKKAIEIFPQYYMALERLGSEYVKLQQYSQSLDFLNRAIAINPKGYLSYYALGIAQYNLKQGEDSIQSLRKSVSLAPQSVNGQFWLGIVLFKTGKFKEAEESLKRAYEIGGSQIPDVHMFLAQIYSHDKRYPEAVNELELFLKEAPNAGDVERIKNVIKQLREKMTTQEKQQS